MAREYQLLHIPGATDGPNKYRAHVDFTSIGDVEYSWDDRWTEYEQSAEFRMFSARERALARYTIKRIAEDEAPWRVQEVEADQEGLMGGMKPRFLVPSTLDDAMILSGARGWEIYQEQIEDDHTNRQYFGKMSLANYVDLSVAAMMYGYSNDGDAHLSYAVEEGDTELRQRIGGTFHGDFAAWWGRFATKGPVYDPAGVARPFAPAVEGDGVRAYHSVEDSIALTMLQYLAAGDMRTLEAQKQVLLRAIEAADQGRSGGNFADFGHGDKSGYASGIFVDNFHPPIAGEVMESFLVVPGDRELCMEIVSAVDGVILRNVRKTKNDLSQQETEFLGQMPVKRDEIPQFVATMAAASAGRTSIDQIRAVISKAHVWE